MFFTIKMLYQIISNFVDGLFKNLSVVAYVKVSDRRKYFTVE
jgi:hypothetical protein